MPRPPKKPTEQDLYEIEMLAGLGLTQQQIADVKDISVDTLRNYSNKSFKKGKSKAIAQLAQTLFKQALSGNTTALIFFLKSQGGWTEYPMLKQFLNMLGEDE